ncbi:hypothetical protein [Magnetovibrio blakemorei]|uniref:Uncharacterized protein n=1 Tax=Magnetovibrio blakemorei TaxID=28181 RepID=A0A1E5Q6A1_9PROT|nr:hypothetical protein [Magnetovibrio blakemorei]OEJ65989.1 hypothetical protein BEN30_13425 [Magnetovibrio blakemorei]
MDKLNLPHSRKDRTAPRRTESDRRITTEQRDMIGDRRQDYFRVEIERRANDERRATADRRELDRRSGRDPRGAQA